MPSVRFSRDKRGYEYVYLMHTPTRRGKPGRSQVLYWYRTPPGVRVGRKPFSEDVQKMLEAQHPGITFDWPTIINTPMPPPDMTEFWREKRRAAKAAKEERRAQEAADAVEEAAAQGEQTPVDVEAIDGETASPDDVGPDDGIDSDSPESASATEGEGGDEATARKRRRRRGGRRRRTAAARSGIASSSDEEGGSAGESRPASDGDADPAESSALVTPAQPPTDPTE